MTLNFGDRPFNVAPEAGALPLASAHLVARVSDNEEAASGLLLSPNRSAVRAWSLMPAERGSSHGLVMSADRLYVRSLLQFGWQVSTHTRLFFSLLNLFCFAYETEWGLERSSKL